MVTSFENLGTLLLGKTRSAVLQLLLGHPDEEFHVRQISRLSGSGLGPVQRDLKCLAEVAILRRREVGRQVFYRANPDSPIHSELAGLVLKTAGAAAIITAALQPVASHIRVAFLFGSVAHDRQGFASDVDVMIVGDVSFTALVAALADPQQKLGRDVNPTLYRADEFASKLRAKHHFLSSVVAGSKIFLVGDQRELSRMAKERLAPAARYKRQ